MKSKNRGNKVICSYEPPPTGCPEIFPSKPKPQKPKIKRQLVKDTICGNIKQNSNNVFEVYWRSFGIHPLPSASVTVLNNSNCLMTVRADLNGDGIAETTLFILSEKDQSKSVTLPSISRLEIRCGGECIKKCSGRFCIELHYEKECLTEETN